MPAGTVLIQTTSPGPNLAITAWIGEAGASPTGGFGGWEMTARPRRVGITQWRGREPIQMDLPLVIDAEAFGGNSGDSVELAISKLERMALPYKTTPPLIKLNPSVPNMIQHTDKVWIINGFTWGTSLRDLQQIGKQTVGDRVRQEVTLALVSYVAVTTVKLKAAARARAKTSG